LVDDDKDILSVLKRGLETRDYKVFDFDSPVKALEYLKTVNRPQLLITDIRMPEMSGFELIRLVQKDHPEISVMAMSSFDIRKSEFDKVFPTIKIDAFVHKPVGMSKFVDTVNAIMVEKKPTQ
jgi:DNA-binding NtrC family response regulator